MNQVWLPLASVNQDLARSPVRATLSPAAKATTVELPMARVENASISDQPVIKSM